MTRTWKDKSFAALSATNDSFALYFAYISKNRLRWILFALSFLIDFFRACWQFASHSREIIENLQFAVQIRIFPTNTLFALATLTLSSVAQNTVHESFVPLRDFGF